LSARARNRRTVLAGILAFAFASAALIPSGFMPAAGWPFALEICHEGLPAGLLTAAGQPLAHHHHHGGPEHESQHHHPGGSTAGEHCVFASLCGSGPTRDPALPNPIRSVQTRCAATFFARAVPARLIHRPQPRAPPDRLPLISSG
jgi:hypothetical protein